MIVVLNNISYLIQRLVLYSPFPNWAQNSFAFGFFRFLAITKELGRRANHTPKTETDKWYVDHATSQRRKFVALALKGWMIGDLRPGN